MTSWGDPPAAELSGMGELSAERRWDDGATPDKPAYRMLPERLDGPAFWMIEVSEGWRTLVLATGIHERYARWLLELLKGRPLPDASQVTRRIT